MAVYVFSGGQDSTVALAMGLHRGDRRPLVLTIDYGQRNRSEISAAAEIVNVLSRKFRDTSPVHHTISIADAASTVWSGCALVSDRVRVRPSNAFVPGRNSLFISVAFSFASNWALREVVFGTTAIDAAASADGSPAYLKAFTRALNKGVPLSGRVKFSFPLLRMSKGEVLQKADQLGILDLVKYECVSCHNGDRTERRWGRGCGRCGACRWRSVGWQEFTGVRGRTIR